MVVPATFVMSNSMWSCRLSSGSSEHVVGGWKTLALVGSLMLAASYRTIPVEFFGVVVCNSRTCIDPKRSQPVITRWSICLNNDVVSLSRIDNDAVCNLGLDKNKVVRDHLQLVPIDTELKLAICADIDQAYQVFFARVEHRL